MNKIILLITIFSIVFSCCKTKEKIRLVDNNVSSTYTKHLFAEFGIDSISNFNIRDIISEGWEFARLSTKGDYIKITKKKEGLYDLNRSRKVLPELFKVFVEGLKEEDNSDFFIIPCYMSLTPKRLDSMSNISINYEEIGSLVSSKLFFEGLGTTFKFDIYKMRGEDKTSLNLIESRFHSNLLIEEFEYFNKSFIDFKDYSRGTYLIKLESSYGVEYECFISIV